jgi:creatinine amidohydrolase
MELRLEALTWQDARERIEQDTEIAVFPIGSMEQHGYHGPLGTDSIIADAVTKDVAKRLNALSLPPLWYGVSSHHMNFSGTITVRPETISHIIEDILDSLIHHGVKKILILNGHGGNTPSIRIACGKVRERHPEVFLAHSSVWLALHDDYDELPDEARQMDWRSLAAHAGCLETSLTMAIDKTMVKLERAVDKPVDRFAQAGDPTLSVIAKVEELTEVGSAGDPTKSSQEMGKVFLERTVDRIVTKFNSALNTFCPDKKTDTKT